MNTYLTTGELNKCYGCLSCVYSCPTGAISIEDRFDNFSYPTVDNDKCIGCDACRRVCPNDSAELKPLMKTYALKLKDVEARKLSSSGGAFTAISDALMKKGYKVYGAVFDENYKVHHIGSFDEAVRNIMRGSKYVESSLVDVFPQIKNDLDLGTKVMFTGVPCQVSGLKTFLKKEYDNLITVDLVCHGALSPKILEDYLAVLSNNSKIKSFAFRDKINHTWDNSEHSVIDCEDKTNLGYIDCYHRFFSRAIGIRNSCESCIFATADRGSDITMGDFWSIGWIKPEFKDDYGVSLVTANSEKGLDIINNEISQYCEIAETPRDKTVASVAQFNYPAPRSSISDMFWKYYKKHSAKKVIDIYGGDSLYSKLHRKPFEMLNSYLKK